MLCAATHGVAASSRTSHGPLGRLARAAMTKAKKAAFIVYSRFWNIATRQFVHVAMLACTWAAAMLSGAMLSGATAACNDPWCLSVAAGEGVAVSATAASVVRLSPADDLLAGYGVPQHG